MATVIVEVEQELLEAAATAGAARHRSAAQQLDDRIRLGGSLLEAHLISPSNRLGGETAAHSALPAPEDGSEG